MSKIITPARRVRLEKLAAYLEGLPANYAHFDMGHWFNADSQATMKYAKHNGGVASCGAVACAVGHGPAAGILVPPRFIHPMGNGRGAVSWIGYALDLFCNGSEQLRMWLFSGSWNEVDNHHYGAAARIRYVLDKGSEPDDFDYEPLRRHLKLYAPYRIDAKALANA